VTPQESKASFIQHTIVLLLSHSCFINTDTIVHVLSLSCAYSIVQLNVLTKFDQASRAHGTSTVKQVCGTTLCTVGVVVETLPSFIIVIQAEHW